MAWRLTVHNRRGERLVRVVLRKWLADRMGHPGQFYAFLVPSDSERAKLLRSPETNKARWFPNQGIDRIEPYSISIVEALVGEQHLFPEGEGAPEARKRVPPHEDREGLGV